MAAIKATADADVDSGTDLDPAANARDPWLPMLAGRSSDPTVCPFLRAVESGHDGRERVVAPVGAPDPANRCAALTEAVPQSLRQQELVCLTSGHSNCPRYLRGAVVVSEPVEAATGGGPAMSPAILGSIAVLVAAFAASIAFVTARGGLAIEPFATTGPSPTTIAQASPEPSVQPSIVVSPAPSAAPSDPTPTAEATVAPTTTAPTAAATPKPTATPGGTSDRYALLKACPDAADCWIYTIRSGDNLSSIANYFGVSLDSVYARNPWTKSTPLRAGQELRLPPPTR